MIQTTREDPMANILVTDDSNFLRRRTCSILKAAGHQITEASDGVECMQLIEQNNPDVVFLDLLMPIMDGFEVLKTLKGMAHSVPVIVLTANIQESVRNECLQLGASNFISKPPTEGDVLSALDAILNNQDATT